MYYILIIVLLILSIGISFMVKARFKKYSKNMASCGLTGAQVAQRLLNANGIYDVNIQQISGSLTDNYNPRTKTLNLSNDVCNKSSISAVVVAAHECGHAIQHATNYGPLVLRKTIVPAANISSSISYILILAGMFFQMANLITIGAILFSVIVFFHFVTLPVEIDASRRALSQIKALGLLNNTELKGGRKVLTAAGLTYFMALLSSIVQLLRLLSIASRRR